jgi:hypothetical protein
MQQDDCIWHLPRLSDRVQLSVRAAMLLVLAMALLWLCSALHGLWLRGALISLEGGIIPVLTVLWLSLWRKLYGAVPQAKDGALVWLEDVPVSAVVRAQAARVRVLFDAGHHVLIHVHHANGHALHWVSDARIPLPWRWRLAAKKAASWHYLTHE